jgi:hypothetical protein
MQALAASCEELRARTGNPPLDENYHVKHDSCTLDFMDASFSFVSIAINKAIISS